MSDGWEDAFQLLRRVPADLHGYARSFTKASVRNWGTPANPGPTLRIVPTPDAVCRGMAFEFPEGQASTVLGYLQGREGKGFAPRSVPISLLDGAPAEATTFIYEGGNVIDRPEEEIANAIRSAVGTSGSARNYLEGIKAQLDQLQIDDPAVTRLWLLLTQPAA